MLPPHVLGFQTFHERSAAHFNVPSQVILDVKAGRARPQIVPGRWSPV